MISAHRDRHFNHFDALAIGDTVITEANGHHNRWVIAARRVIDKDAPAIFKTNSATLTLTITSSTAHWSGPGASKAAPDTAETA